MLSTKRMKSYIGFILFYFFGYPEAIICRIS